MYSLVSQSGPSQPSAQMHWYAFTLSIHVPPLPHGPLSQSLMSKRKREGNIHDWTKRQNETHRVPILSPSTNKEIEVLQICKLATHPSCASHPIGHRVHLHTATRLAHDWKTRQHRSLTLVAVGSGEALLTLAAEMAAGEAVALPVRTAHAGRDVAHVSRGAVRNHRDRAAVNHCEREIHGRGLYGQIATWQQIKGKFQYKPLPALYIFLKKKKKKDLLSLLCSVSQTLRACITLYENTPKFLTALVTVRIATC